MLPNMLKTVLSLTWLGLLMTGILPAYAGDEVVVGDIQFVKEKGGIERVCFLLNPFCSPKVFSLEGTHPRIVIDIMNVHSWKDKPKMPVEGVLIRQVRTHFHKDKNKLRIVLDLMPSMDYTAEPFYYKAEGIYCMAVSGK